MKAHPIDWLDCGNILVERMPKDDKRTRAYRRLVVALVLCMAVGVATVGAKLAWQGKGYPAILALLVLGWLILVVYGYRQDERDSDR